MKTLKVISFSIIIAFLLGSCSNGLMEFGKPESKTEDGGNVTITLQTGNAGRTLRPDEITDLSVFKKIEFSFTNVDDEEETASLLIDDFSGEPVFTTTLGIGEWDIIVTGHIEIGGRQYEAARGSSSIEVTAAGAKAEIELYTGIFDGLDGVFSYDVGFPDGVEVEDAFLKITPFDAFNGNGDTDEEGIDLSEEPDGSFDLAPGYYLLTINAVSDDEKTAAWAELVHIYSGQETRAIHTFTVRDFRGLVEISYEIELVVTGKEGEDSVEISPEFGVTGTVITITYTVDDISVNNQLVFNRGISSVDIAGSGEREYTVNADDADANGVIVIEAEFTHTDLELDLIEFEDTAKNMTYGDNDNTFIKAVVNTGEGTGAITYSSGDEDIAEVDEDTGEVTVFKAGQVRITATKAADDEYEYTTAYYDLTVNPRPLTITGLSAVSKTYDGKTAAEFEGEPELENTFCDDDVIIVIGTAFFEDRNVGEGITVNFAQWSLDGEDKDNYTLLQPESDTADITALQLTINAPTGAFTRAYNGTNNAAGVVTIGALQNRMSNDAGQPDDVTVSLLTATFLSAEVLLTPENAVDTGANEITIVYSISGDDVDNYIKPVDYTREGTITRAPGAVVDGIPTMAAVTHNTINVSALSVVAPELPMVNEQAVEYAISTSSAPGPNANLTWQAGLVFSNLAALTDYYVFARSAQSKNYSAGATTSRVMSEAIRTFEHTTDETLSFTVTNNVTYETVTFTGTGIIAPLSAGDTRTISVSNATLYESFMWIVNGVTLPEAGNSITIDGIKYPVGEYQVLVIVHRAGNPAPYSQRIYFTVVE